MKARIFLRSHPWVVLVLWARAQYCWKTHSWPLKRIVLRGFTTPCNTSSWYTQAPVFNPFLTKMKRCHPLMGHPTPNHDVGWEMASLHPWNLFFCLMGHLSINLVILAVVLLLGGEYFLIREENVFVPVLGVPLEEPLCSCPWDLLQSGSKVVSLQTPVCSHVQIVPDEARYWLGRYVQLSGHAWSSISGEQISVNLLPHCFYSSFSPHASRVFWPSPVFNPLEFLIM